MKTANFPLTKIGYFSLIVKYMHFFNKVNYSRNRFTQLKGEIVVTKINLNFIMSAN